MRKKYKVQEWMPDCARLKSARKIRNDLAHSDNSMADDICSQEDIDFIVSFRERILNQADPLAMLRKLSVKPQPPEHQQPKKRYKAACSVPSGTHIGCFGIAALLLIAAACAVAFLFEIMY